QRSPHRDDDVMCASLNAHRRALRFDRPQQLAADESHVTGIARTWPVGSIVWTVSLRAADRESSRAGAAEDEAPDRSHGRPTALGHATLPRTCLPREEIMAHEQPEQPGKGLARGAEGGRGGEEDEGTPAADQARAGKGGVPEVGREE
ncbi:hypothetical protein THAOC_15688, partial [Thalassiosira oceanica]